MSYLHKEKLYQNRNMKKKTKQTERFEKAWSRIEKHKHAYMCGHTCIQTLRESS